MIGRRGFITGLVAVVAAPAIVRVGSLMPVRAERGLSIEQIINMALQQINPPIVPLSDFSTFRHAWLKDWEVAAQYVQGDVVQRAGITYRPIL